MARNVISSTEVGEICSRSGLLLKPRIKDEIGVVLLWLRSEIQSI